jgi:hypothetical protein
MSSLLGALCCAAPVLGSIFGIGGACYSSDPMVGASHPNQRRAQAEANTR